MWKNSRKLWFVVTESVVEFGEQYIHILYIICKQVILNSKSTNLLRLFWKGRHFFFLNRKLEVSPSKTYGKNTHKKKSWRKLVDSEFRIGCRHVMKRMQDNNLLHLAFCNNATSLRKASNWSLLGFLTFNILTATWSPQ